MLYHIKFKKSKLSTWMITLKIIILGRYMINYIHQNLYTVCLSVFVFGL